MLSMIALTVLLATPVMITMAVTFGERQATGAQQGKSEKQAGDEWHRGFLLRSLPRHAAGDSCDITVETCA
jgi:hypothetical protein